MPVSELGSRAPRRALGMTLSFALADGALRDAAVAEQVERP
ncbi:MAG TPA: hypothetical protein VJ862_10235 [Rhodanobacteraceae bacterium]|nr:hypothetical protein [Rhodanobacteraceae bacterium]